MCKKVYKYIFCIVIKYVGKHSNYVDYTSSSFIGEAANKFNVSATFVFHQNYPVSSAAATLSSPRFVEHLLYTKHCTRFFS